MFNKFLVFTARKMISFILASASLWICSNGWSLDSYNQSNAKASAKLVIVMDDLGNNLATGRRAIDLPGALTYAILPHTPAAKKLAYYAATIAENKEVIIHMPMEAKNSNSSNPNGLLTSLDRDHFVLKLEDAFEQIPFAKGLSNHMGSHLTQMNDQMQWLMTELEKRNLYFVDSKTTGKSVAMAAALEQRVPYLARDIFLDHDPSPEAINHAFQKALRLARQTGIAVLICHPYPTTLDYLEQMLPQLDQTSVSLATVSTVLPPTAKLSHSNQRRFSVLASPQD